MPPEEDVTRTAPAAIVDDPHSIASRSQTGDRSATSRPSRSPVFPPLSPRLVYDSLLRWISEAAQVPNEAANAQAGHIGDVATKEALG